MPLAAWKIIRSWLSEDARQLVKYVRNYECYYTVTSEANIDIYRFVNKAELLEFVDSDKLLVKFGGTVANH